MNFAAKEKRHGDLPIPEELDKWLNWDQRQMLGTIEGFGWDLKYVRRSNNSKPTIIVVNPEGTRIGILEDDGQLNLEHEVKLRD